MDAVVDGARPKPARPPKDLYRAQIRLSVVMILIFAVLPGALLLTVGILVLAFGHQPHDIVFGVLIVALTATLTAGITFTFLYVRRSTSLARLQTEFVQKVSHDLRTPLTSIRMFVETLQSGRLTERPQIDECLDVLSAETARLMEMVERLLTWAKMEAGKRVYTRQRARPDKIVLEALEALEPQAHAAELDGAHVDITRELADHLPDIEADADAMTDALVNVLQNALRYTGRSKEIRVRVTANDKNVDIAITDNGPGIARHEQSKIFEKFYRVLDPAAPNVEGTGLGLAMVHHVVRAHGGRITVESDLGKGATFIISLPAVAPRVEAS
jgi:two-component system phosphate regulon sensor histidine kinase PhoR